MALGATGNSKINKALVWEHRKYLRERELLAEEVRFLPLIDDVVAQIPKGLARSEFFETEFDVPDIKIHVPERDTLWKKTWRFLTCRACGAKKFEVEVVDRNIVLSQIVNEIRSRLNPRMANVERYLEGRRVTLRFWGWM